jgi:hypothetical protein
MSSSPQSVYLVVIHYSVYSPFVIRANQRVLLPTLFFYPLQSLILINHYNLRNHFQLHRYVLSIHNKLRPSRWL